MKVKPLIKGLWGGRVLTGQWGGGGPIKGLVVPGDPSSSRYKLLCSAHALHSLLNLRAITQKTDTLSSWTILQEDCLKRDYSWTCLQIFLKRDSRLVDLLK